MFKMAVSSQGALTVVRAVIMLVVSIGNNTDCEVSDGVNFSGAASSAIDLLYACGLLAVSSLWRRSAAHKCCATILPNFLVKPSILTII